MFCWSKRLLAWSRSASDTMLVKLTVEARPQLPKASRVLAEVSPVLLAGAMLPLPPAEDMDAVLKEGSTEASSNCDLVLVEVERTKGEVGSRSVRDRPSSFKTSRRCWAEASWSTLGGGGEEGGG